MADQPFSSIVPEPEREQLDSFFLKRTQRKNLSPAHECAVVRKDGSTIEVEFVAVFLEREGRIIITCRDVTEWKTLQDKLSRHLNELGVLEAIYSAFTGSMSPQAMLSQGTHKMMDVLKWETGAIYVVDGTSHEIVMRYHRGLPEQFAEKVRTLPLEEGLGGFLSKTHEPQLFTLKKYPSYLPYRSLFETHAVKAICLLPLIAKEKFISFILLCSKHEEAGRRHSAELLKLISTQIGSLIGNAQLFSSVKELEERQYHLIESLSAGHNSSALELIWSVQPDAAAIERASRQSDQLRGQIWEPFERCARVLDRFGYLDFAAERVTERGKWLADLRVDRPLLIGEALQRNLFAALTETQVAALVAALAADEDRDYGELELDDSIVSLLIKFEEVSFEVSNEEWKQGIEAAPEINFSAAAAAALWTRGGDWPTLVRETRAEEGDLIRLLSRTGEALLQIAGLREKHAEAAKLATQAAEIVLREPVR